MSVWLSVYHVGLRYMDLVDLIWLILIIELTCHVYSARLPIRC